MSEIIVQCFIFHSFLFLDLTRFIIENVLSHMYVLPNNECIFS